MAEAGFPGVEMEQWFGLFGPAGMPADRHRSSTQRSSRRSKSDEVQKRVAAGLDHHPGYAEGSRGDGRARHRAARPGREGFRRQAGVISSFQLQVRHRCAFASPSSIESAAGTRTASRDRSRSPANPRAARAAAPDRARACARDCDRPAPGCPRARSAAGGGHRHRGEHPARRGAARRSARAASSNASWMPPLRPMPPAGVLRCAASPASSMRPLAIGRHHPHMHAIGPLLGDIVGRRRAAR